MVRPSAKYLPGGNASGLVFSFSRVSHFLGPSSALGLFTLGFFPFSCQYCVRVFRPLLFVRVTHPIF